GLEARDGPVPEPSAALGGLHGPEPLAGFRPGLAGEVADVVAVVAVFGERHVVALELEPADLEGLTQPLHLGARVVDVELAGDVVSGPLQETGDSVAQRGAAAVGDVERPRRVGRDELDLDADSRAAVGPAEGAVRCEDLRQFALEDGVL